MKRSLDGSELPGSKKSRTDGSLENITSTGVDLASSNDEDVIFDPSRRKPATDICQLGIDEDAFIVFKVSLTYSNSRKDIHIQGDAQGHGDLTRLEVVFSDRCLRFLRLVQLKFEPQDVIELSLKGAVMTRMSTSGSKTLPITLRYSEGVRMRFKVQKRPLAIGTYIDSWSPQSTMPTLGHVGTGDAPLQDDWFSTPSTTIPIGATGSAGSIGAAPTSLDADSAHKSKNGTESHTLEQSSESAGAAKATTADDSAIQRPAQKLYRDTGPHKKQKQKGRDRAQKTTPSTSKSPDPGPLARHSSHESTKTSNTTSHESKKQEKARKRKERLALMEAEAVGSSTKPASECPPPEPQQVESITEPISKALPQQVSPTPVLQPVPQIQLTKSPPTLPPPPPLVQPAPQIVTPPEVIEIPSSSAANLVIKPEPEVEEIVATWTTIANLGIGKCDCIIGVVANIGETRSSTTAEKFRKIVVVDHTNVDQDNLFAGFSITCFVRVATIEALPPVERGDVIAMRNVTIEHFSGSGRLNGSCPSYKLWSWSIFHPQDRTLRHGGINMVQGLTVGENQYCLKLAEWWSEMVKIHEDVGTEEGVIVHQIGGANDTFAAAANPRCGRIHRLLKDASPDAPPSGYFDCTIEVLSGHQNDNGVYSLYVTDYTRNESIHPITATWCSPALSELVFKIELWNEAAVKGPEMKAHEYYEIKNCRIKMSAGGYWEGSFSEVKKLRKLDDEELDEEPHLVELLRRKKQWQDDAEATNAHKFPHRLFKDASPDSHFDCTAEVLRISLKDESRALIYVTDYTARNDLTPIAATADWTRGIEHDKIAKVAIFNSQVDVARGLSVGDFIAIRHLRLKRTSSGTVAGMIGGDERLIFKLDPRNSGHEHLPALLKRKEEFEEALERKQSGRKKSARNAPVEPEPMEEVEPAVIRKKPPPPRPADAITLQELGKLDATAGPVKYRILGRVVDHWPNNIADFVVLYCTNCGRDIAEHLRICTTCDEDMAESYVRPCFRFWLEIEDDEGTRIRLPIPSTTGNGCGFLQGIEPVDLREDPEALEDLKTKLRPLLGELTDKLENLAQHATGEDLHPDTPFLNMVLAKTPSHATLMFWNYSPL